MVKINLAPVAWRARNLCLTQSEAVPGRPAARGRIEGLAPTLQVPRFYRYQQYTIPAFNIG